jgi:prevent-host-death family protein
MAVITVGIRELKTRLGMYMQRVQAGGTIVITDRGKPVGRIIPVKSSAEVQVQELIQAGLVAWSGDKLTHRPTGTPSGRAPAARTRGKTTVADLLVEDRE